MTRYRSFLSLVAALLMTAGMSPSALAQPGVYYEEVNAGQFFMCAWENARVHEYPNLGAGNVGTIVFTEEVHHLGREAFVRSENRNYLFVETEDGAEGWVNEAYLVAGGGAVVLLDAAPIFQKPNTNTAITDQAFEPGDIVILSEFKDGWVYLTGERKEKQGWVQGYDKLSAETYDIEAATLLASAMEQESDQAKVRELRELRGGRAYLSPAMQQIIDQRLVALTRGQQAPSPQPSNPIIYYDEPTTPYNQPAYPAQPNTPYYANGEDAFAGPTRNQGVQPLAHPGYQPTPNVPAVTRSNYALQEREVVDMATGRSYIRVRETGTIQPVKAKKPKTKYYAYHKSLPLGATVLLAVPGTELFIELEIIARLRPDNDHMIGLSGEVIQEVFGEIAAKDVGSVTIEYPKP